MSNVYKTSCRIFSFTTDICYQQLYSNKQLSRCLENRPVSILPVLSKFYEKPALQQVAVFIESESVYHQYQSGYRKNHSTTTLLLKLHDDIK